jgi:transposase-like protein
VDRKKGQRYSKEFRHQAVERMNTSAGFSRELGVARHLLYNWRDRSEHTRSHSLIKLRFSIRRGIQHASRAI